ncbi:MAG: Na+/H+ antiporter NhaC [Myxococcota bacterium]
MSTAWSLLPPLVALGLAVTTRRVVPSLAAGGLTGTVLIAGLDGGWGPVSLARGVLDFVGASGILGQVSKPSQAQVMLLIALIGGFVALLEQSGAARALAALITRGVRTPRQAMLATWAGGLALFFSDFGNVLILGPIFRPIYDALAIPREKLAWIIDSTAAPVCVLLPFVTWGVYAMGLIEQGFTGLDPVAVEAVAPGLWSAESGTVDGFSAFVRAIPFQLYSLTCLALIPLVVAAGLGPTTRGGARPPEVEAPAGPLPTARTAVLPLVVLFAVTAAVAGSAVASDGRLTGEGVRLALAAAYLAAIGTCLGLLAAQGRGEGMATVTRDGLGRTAPLLVLLLLAWTLGDVCRTLGTGAYLAGVLGPWMSAGILPMALFAVGGLTSFATGTSWGTFAILMPLAIPLSVSLGAPAEVCIAAVLSGGVFGDHCSPISDTTLLASLAAGVDHADHVASQLPYALLAGAAAAVGFAVAGVTGSPWSLAPALLVLVLAVGVGAQLRPRVAAQG